MLVVSERRWSPEGKVNKNLNDWKIRNKFLRVWAHPHSSSSLVWTSRDCPRSPLRHSALSPFLPSFSTCSSLTNSPTPNTSRLSVSTLGLICSFWLTPIKSKWPLNDPEDTLCANLWSWGRSVEGLANLPQFDSSFLRLNHSDRQSPFENLSGVVARVANWLNCTWF